jgi:hypothetical protein
MSFLSFLLLASAPAAPSPPADSAQSAEVLVRATLDEAMRAISAGDPEQLRPLLRPYGNFTVMEEHADGTRKLTSGAWDAYLEAMKSNPPNIEERLHDVQIRVDGTVADTWAPFTLFLNGKVAGCGIDHVQLVLDEGRWKIQNVMWTERETGCPL